MSHVDWFSIEKAREKVDRLPGELQRLLSQPNPSTGHGALRTENRVPVTADFKPGRDVAVVDVREVRNRKLKLSSNEGQARLLHDLANIELQAMELAVRTLLEFPEAPQEFREQLAEVALGESRHLTLCLDGIDHFGFHWGHWSAHLALWNAVDAGDSLLDRILIVHRYLEGSGLDAGDSILRRLIGVESKVARHAVELIVREEVDHVLFGSRWYHRLAQEQKIDVEKDFAERLARIAKTVPRREQIARDLRVKAGFTEFEIAELIKYGPELKALVGS
jgi:uncharacterized ferritin-like protein (DUF455 family)